MQNHAADELHVEVHHVPGHRLIADREGLLSLSQAARRIFNNRERFGQNFIELVPLLDQIRNGGELRLPLRRFRAQLIVRERLQLLVDLVHAAHRRRHSLDLALIL